VLARMRVLRSGRGEALVHIGQPESAPPAEGEAHGKAHEDLAACHFTPDGLDPSALRQPCSEDPSVRAETAPGKLRGGGLSGHHRLGNQIEHDTVVAKDATGRVLVAILTEDDGAARGRADQGCAARPSSSSGPCLRDFFARGMMIFDTHLVSCSRRPCFVQQSASTPPSRSFQPLAPAEERELVGRMKAGDESALDRILAAYWHGLTGFALRILGDRDRAEDVVQEAFIRLWNRRTEWNRSDTLRPVLYQIVRNRALNEERQAGVVRKWAQRLRRPERDPAPDPLESVQQGELAVRLRKAIESLPARRREIFILVRYHQHSYREAGQVLSLSPQTVANQMTLAMKDLRAMLDPYAEDFGVVQDLHFPSTRTG